MSAAKKILLGCYHSSELYNAITRNGHMVTSCDLKPSQHSGLHFQDDIMNIDLSRFDAALFFPPCQFLAKAQFCRYKKEPTRYAKRDEALAFVKHLYNSGIAEIAIENPIGYLNINFKAPSQIIRPYHFGDPYRKDICLWLRNLPPLISTMFNTSRKSISNHVNSRMSAAEKSEIKSSWNRFPGTCQAIANQWFPPVPGQSLKLVVPH